jgi:hypothetical protein
LQAKLTVYEEKAPYSNTIKLVIVAVLFLLAFMYFIAMSLARRLNRRN